MKFKWHDQQKLSGNQLKVSWKCIIKNDQLLLENSRILLSNCCIMFNKLLLSHFKITSHVLLRN